MELMQNVKETYSKDGKKLSKLIQEWMEENNYIFYCKDHEENTEYACR